MAVRDDREVTLLLNTLEQRIEEVRLAFQMYFEGVERRPPLDKWAKLKSAVRKLVARHIANTQHRFRLQALVARYNSYNGMWERTMSEIEQGRYRPDRFKADLRFAGRKPPTGAPPEGTAPKTDPVRGVYEDFIAKRKQTGESTNIAYEKFAALIERQKPELSKKLGVDRVEFRVVIEDGKAKLKGSGRK